MTFLRSEHLGPVLRLTLSDEKTRNSLSTGMIAELDAAIAESNAQVIVIDAQGPVFCSGHNLKELTARRVDADGGEAFFKEVFSNCAALMTRIATYPGAVIAEVDGLASAAGCQLVAACDLAFASPRATFCTPGVNIGLFCSTPMVPLSRAVGQKHAMEMLLTGDIFDAAFAQGAGLINHIVPQNELHGHVIDAASKIASKSAHAIAHGKKLFHQQRPLPIDEAYAVSAAVMVQNMLEGSAIEGIGAFVEKRSPKWPSRS